MIEILKPEYIKKGDNFILPLTELSKKLKINSYLFWEDYSIENYNLVIEVDEKEDVINEYVIPVLNKNNYIIECYEDLGKTYFILDLTEWYTDIEFILKGSYSKISGRAKVLFEKFHSMNNSAPIAVAIYGIIHPNVKLEVLDLKTPIDYIIEHYKFDEDLLRKVGEIGGIYKKEEETLNLKINTDKICQI